MSACGLHTPSVRGYAGKRHTPRHPFGNMHTLKCISLMKEGQERRMGFRDPFLPQTSVISTVLD
jgi:hypothetical protein